MNSEEKRQIDFQPKQKSFSCRIQTTIKGNEKSRTKVNKDEIGNNKGRKMIETRIKQEKDQRTPHYNPINEL